GMPRELEFKFQPSARQDDKAIADAEDVRIRNGSLTLNEARAKNGLPLLDAEEADLAIFVGAGAYALTQQGAISFDGSTDQPLDSFAIEAEPVEVEVVPEKGDDQAEVRKFIKWLRKSPNKSFQFDFVPQTYAETLNKFVAVKDYDGARWYAERYLG
ncbi:MAG: hypothetical protein WCO24_04490, partial [Actinomycetes bacterium]